MWTVENRARYDRSRLRHPSDLGDAERALIAPAKRGGNERRVDGRAVVDGAMYLLSTGCQWAALPKDPPPRSAANDCFRRWEWDGTLERLHHALWWCEPDGRCRLLRTTGALISWADSPEAWEPGVGIGPLEQIAFGWNHLNA